MAVHDEIGCNGYSGSAAPFVTQVQVSVDGKVVATHTHSATDDGPWWSFDGALSIVGRQTVTITDRTAGNDYHGEPDNLHRVVELDCPVPTTTDAPTTTEQATTTTDYMAKVPVLEVDPTVPQSPETTVLLSTVSPSTTNFEGMDGFYVLSETETSTTEPFLPATGPNVAPLLGAGSAALALGVLCARLAARPRRA